MIFSKKYHLFEWLINLLLVIGPLLLIGYGMAVPANWIEMVLGTVFMLPVSLGGLLFYSWLAWQNRRLAGYQWGILVGYALLLVVSAALLISFYCQ